MKNMVKLLVLAGLLLVIQPSPVIAAGEITVELDGMPLKFEVAPQIYNSRTMVPFRAIAENLGVVIQWEDKTKTIHAQLDQQRVVLHIGESKATINDAVVYLDSPPMIVNGRTLIPLRFFAEAFACQVNWDPAGQKVLLVSPPSTMQVMGFYALGDSRTSSWQDLFGSPYPNAEKGNTDIVSDAAFGWYSIDRDGNLLTASRTGWQRPSGWQDVLTAARQFNMATEMVIHVTNGDRTITDLINNEAAVSKFIEQVKVEAALYDGVNLDFEGLGLSEKGSDLILVQQKFTYLVEKLYTALQADCKILTLTLHAPNSSYRGYDYSALAVCCDRIVIMAYDYGGRPEPVGRVNQAVEMALQSVPANKLLLGISTPSETAESIPVKIGIAKRHKLAGIAIWRLGLVSPDAWTNIRTSIISRQ